MEVHAVFAMVVAVFTSAVHGHGRLIEPPSRATAWRYGFSLPANYNDHELYCGGFSRQHQRNKGRCGPCGDPWDLPQPRPHENGGAYGKGVIVQSYRPDSDMEIGVELTANHRGYFEFRLCPLNQQKTPETDECFDRHLLTRSDGQGARFHPEPGTGTVSRVRYKLPANLECSRCVLQWRYVAGNNWGMCTNGTGRVGCGSQEEFRSCSDIRISSKETPAAFYTTTTKKPGGNKGTVVYQHIHRPTVSISTTTAATTTTYTPAPATSLAGLETALPPNASLKSRLFYLLRLLLKKLLKKGIDSAYNKVSSYLT